MSSYVARSDRGSRHVRRGVPDALRAAGDHGGDTEHWALEAARSMTGFATSVIGCKCEAAIERTLDAGRHARRAARGSPCCCSRWTARASASASLERVGQSVMTCPTTACFDGLPGAERTVPLGESLRYFGDGFQASKVIGGRRFWRIPVMEGEFLVSETVGVGRGVGGGNLVIGAGDDRRRAGRGAGGGEAMRGEGIALPFPGGIVRSGSKVGALTSSRCRPPPTIRWHRRCACR